MSDSPQRREFSRVPIHLRAELEMDGRRYQGTVENLSLKGGFFRAAETPGDGARVEVHLHLEGTPIEVHTQGHVVRRGPEGCALQFDEIVGVESLEHLRNLVLFNSHNPAQIEQEFHEHLGLRRDG